MKGKLLPLLLALLLCLCGCEEGAGGGAGEPTEPLVRITRALQDGNTGMYETAFPADFVEGYRSQYGDLSKTLRELLSTARSKNKSDCGENWTLRYEVESKETVPVEGLESTVILDRLNEFSYTLPKERVTDAAKLTVTVYLEGGMARQSFENTFTVLCIDGIWYLHPMHFGTVLKRS